MADMPAGIRTYIDNTAKACGKSEAQMLAVLEKSGLTKHGDLLAHAKAQLGIGHGHANALVAYYLKPEWRGAAGKPAAKAAAKKPAAKK
jgi:hypothetical protein